MIPVPHSVLESLANLIGTKAAHLGYFGGGQESSDGIVYAYPYEDTQPLLKIMAIAVENQHRGLLCLQERLNFVRFLGENGAPIVFPKPAKIKQKADLMNFCTTYIEGQIVTSASFE